MLTPQQKVPSVLTTPENIALLLVTPSAEDETAVRQIIKAPAISKISRCAGVEDTLQELRSITPAVVLCERDLPDGSWKAILGACEALEKSPLVVVVSRHADDHLWAEVLNLGGYDVLLKPFDAMEVTRVVASSCRQWMGAPARQSVASQRQTHSAVTAQVV
jgi:DNA-binding response OmpR family regulator